MSSTRPAEANFALLLTAAWLLVVVQLLAGYWGTATTALHDGDDALRLVEVRDFLAGAGWYDLHQPRLGPPFGYDSHWSRLIDAGLAGLFLFFRLFAGAAFAERLMLAVWPLLWLLPVIAATAAIAWRLGGRTVAIMTLLLAVFAIPGFYQFRPGRIDHHNVHIALALLAAAATVWSDRARWCCYAAGTLAGVAVAIGFEAAAFHVLFGAAFVLRYVQDAGAAPSMRAYLLSFAISTLTVFAGTVPPALWLRPICDVLAVNSAGAVITGCVTLAAASLLVSGSWKARLGVSALCGVASLVVFLAFEPRCIAGPYALVDPAVRPIWLDFVTEARSIFDLFIKTPATGLEMFAFPAACLLALMVIIKQRPDLRGDFGFRVAAATFFFSFLLFVGAVRLYSYAIWLGLPFAAAAVCVAFERYRIGGLVPRFLLGLLVTPTAVTLGAITLGRAAGQDKLIDLTPPERQACVSKASYEPMARLPQGLVLADALEWGAFVLAWTPHSAVAAPYHRITDSIITWHAALSSPPDAARDIIRQHGVTYIAMCGPGSPMGLGEAQLAASLWTKLHAGDVPDWLERLPRSDDQPFSIYRVRG